MVEIFSSSLLENLFSVLSRFIKILSNFADFTSDGAVKRENKFLYKFPYNRMFKRFRCALRMKIKQFYRTQASLVVGTR